MEINDLSVFFGRLTRPHSSPFRALPFILFYVTFVLHLLPKELIATERACRPLSRTRRSGHPMPVRLLAGRNCRLSHPTKFDVSKVSSCPESPRKGMSRAPSLVREAKLNILGRWHCSGRPPVSSSPLYSFGALHAHLGSPSCWFPLAFAANGK